MLLTHPELPTCDDCLVWLYDREWKRATRGGKEVRRPAGASTPCHLCPKSRDCKPNPDAELSQKNSRALQLYMEIKAGRPMPDDRIVQRNCALIRWVEDGVARGQLAGANVTPIIQAVLARGR